MTWNELRFKFKTWNHKNPRRYHKVWYDNTGKTNKNIQGVILLNWKASAQQNKQTSNNNKCKGSLWDGRKYLQTTYLIRNYNIQDSHTEKFIQLNSKKSVWFKKQAEDLNRHFSQRRHKMANGYMKMYSIPLIITSKSEPPMKYHLIPIRMAIIKKKR